ncbi:dynein axonemal assembly factor 4-like isoform X2 [Myxocyprinus asiaticus]|uniref:dynein axonemal assembly factor 4-like isoform X2 n=1 Tax=Myxocyprinus asiaticus TaxID=70543 RepID=UPI0022226FB1|nr:dynein axonemal assembly factor 4-like isoform X2 [Myxocyprinus asiaticus]
MPLIVSDYTWTQSQSTVYISVPLKGVKTAKVDVLCTDEYLKVSFPPFLFEAFLFQPIDEEKSGAKIGNGVAVFTLQKKREELWEKLITNIDKDKQRLTREQAILKVQEKAVEKAKAKASRIQQERKYALETMMKLEKEEQDMIQKVKDDECARATAELEVWRETQRKPAEEKDNQLKQQESGKQNNKPIFQNTERANATPAARQLHNTGQKSSKQKPKVLPAPRSAGCIKISFTPRMFPTALRESRVPEEEEWLRKQAEARRAANADLAELKDLSEEERNPDWLKEKGDKFFMAENYQAAINAYNLAIKLNRKIAALFSNRAACHLKLRNCHKAIEDSSQALELLMPAVTANATARLKAHVRRGTAFCELELYVEGLQDFQAALEIDPHNAALKADTDRIRQIVQGTTSCK